MAHSRIFVVTTNIEPSNGSIDNLEDLLSFSESDFYDDGGYKPEMADWVSDETDLKEDTEWCGNTYNIPVSFVSLADLGLTLKKVKELSQYFPDENEEFFSMQIGAVKIKDFIPAIEKFKDIAVKKARELLNKDDISDTDRWNISETLNPKTGYFFVVGHNESLMNEFDFLDWLKTTEEDEYVYFIKSFDYHM
jgi:hypothetical protein